MTSIDLDIRFFISVSVKFTPFYTFYPLTDNSFSIILLISYSDVTLSIIIQNDI